MNQVTCPQVVDISKLFNPQSYLTAIKQICCQNQGLELDKLQVFTEVTKKPDAKSIDGPCKDGAYVSGMYLEGARWDQAANSLEDSKPKEMFTAMPVITCKAGISSDLGQFLCGQAKSVIAQLKIKHSIFRLKYPAVSLMFCGTVD